MEILSKETRWGISTVAPGGFKAPGSRKNDDTAEKFSSRHRLHHHTAQPKIPRAKSRGVSPCPSIFNGARRPDVRGAAVANLNGLLARAAPGLRFKSTSTEDGP
jgi:hypothetical protein